MRLQLLIALFGSVLALRTQQEPLEFDDCLNTRGYVSHQNSQGLILMSKHLGSRNCLQLNVYKPSKVDLKFLKQDRNGEALSLQYDPSDKRNTTEGNVTMTVIDMRANVVYTDRATRKSVIYMKARTTEVILEVPFDYHFFELLKDGVIVFDMWLDVYPVTNALQSFTLLDKAVLIAETFNVLVLVDLGLLYVMLFRKRNLVNRTHSRLMWLVLILELLALCYFLFRYQLYFWTRPMLFYYFLVSILINVFSILNTSVGVFLLTAIFERHINQNVPLINKLHRFIGYVAFVVMKARVVFKILILVYVVELAISVNDLLAVLVSPVLWLLYAVFWLGKFVIK